MSSAGGTHVTPWAGWPEWSRAYSDLFALDEPLRRAAGVKCVEGWRLRGRHLLPLAVDATASFTELALIDAAGSVSDHALCLMYAMAITRLVNGVVDPLQQGARAASVKRLAETVGLSTALVELRHECTHNRLPSLDRLRLAGDDALLWLHEHYWLPQRDLHEDTTYPIQACLCEYVTVSAERCTGGEPPLRKDVVACVQGLEKAMTLAQLASRLLPILLDVGFLAPAPTGEAVDAATIPQASGISTGDHELCKEAMLVSSDGALLRRVWAPLLARLARIWPQRNFYGTLLRAAAQRLCDEARAIAHSADVSRVLALEDWCMHILDTTDGVDAPMQPEAKMDTTNTGPADASHHSDLADDESLQQAAVRATRLEPSDLVQATWLAARAAQGRGRGVVLRAVKHASWPSEELRTKARRLVQLQDATEKVRRGDLIASPGRSSDVDDAANSARVPHTVMVDTVVNKLAPPLPSNPMFRICAHWVPTAIGAPPPSSALAAVLASTAAKSVEPELVQESALPDTGLPQSSTHMPVGNEPTHYSEDEPSHLQGSPCDLADMPTTVACETAPSTSSDVRILYRRVVAPADTALPEDGALVAKASKRTRPASAAKPAAASRRKRGRKGEGE